MQLALDEAWKYQGQTYPNPAVGAVVLDTDGKLLSVEAHQSAGEAHAELLALRSAYAKKDETILLLENPFEINDYLLKNHNNYFKDATVYVTLEPCAHVGKTPSCAVLLSQLGLKSVYIGSNDTNAIASGGADILQKCNIEVNKGLLQEQCDALLEPFLRWQESRFVFFKWAQRLNGTIDGGAVSSHESRVKVHKMRSVCDLLVIGGNSVRIDRPLLDARLVDGRAPDVLIYSTQKEFDKTIPLFGVAKRKVMVSDNLDILKQYKNVMIEGGAALFEAVKESITHQLVFCAPSFGGSQNFDIISESFEFLNLQKDEQDIILWMKRRQ